MGDYKHRIEDELYRNCDDIITTIRNSVLTKESDDESRAFFLKMIGDYCRYVAESAKGERLEKTKQDALGAYEEACGIAQKSLNACNSIRLGLALNFSVFHYEVMQDVRKACELGDKALQDALDKLDDCDEETFRDAQSIIELLRENLSLWKEEDDNDQQWKFKWRWPQALNEAILISTQHHTPCDYDLLSKHCTLRVVLADQSVRSLPIIVHNLYDA